MKLPNFLSILCFFSDIILLFHHFCLSLHNNNCLKYMDCCYNLRIKAIVLLSTLATMAHAQAENMDTIADTPHLAAYLVAALMISVFTMVFTNRIFYYRQKEVTNHTRQLNTQLALVLLSNKTQLWTYDVNKRIISLISAMDEDKKAFTPIDFAQFFDHEDFNQLYKTISAVRRGEKEQETIAVHGSIPEDGGKQQLFMINVTVLQRDSHGKPKMLLGIQRDITDITQRKEDARKLALQFHTVFNSSLVDMIYYDADGWLTDINETACETFGIKDREELMKRHVNIRDIPSYRELDLEHLDYTQLASITDIDKVKHDDERIPELTIGGKFYYEATVNAVRNKEGQTLGFVAAGRNITEMVESHHRQQEDSELLKKATSDIKDYINNINYSLKVSGVRLINYLPDKHELVVFSDLNQPQYRLSQIRCISLIAEQERRRVRGLFLRMDRHTPGNINTTLQTIFHDEQGRSVFWTFWMVPVVGKDGIISHYFGLCRNESEMVYTEQMLIKETKKAQETEELKNTFLLNMSHEIRTPLNAVLGFAELFNGPHEEEDEPVFADEIKRNTNDLLTLVNDILFISRLDARMIEFNYVETDFSKLFDGFCYMGWDNIAPTVKVTVENPYSRLMVKIDEQHLGKIIGKLCQGAAIMTTTGTIRAKYDYRQGGLNITIEDTGRGLDKERLKHLFDRFANGNENQRWGTGLDMPIIQELVRQMGGSIEIQSEEGKGTTVYVTIPCEMTALEKNSEQAILTGLQT